MKHTVLLIAFLWVCMKVPGQDFNNYVPLKSNGTIPAILTRSYPDHVNEELAKLKKDDPSLYEKKQFTIYTRLIMSRLLMNGRLLINDSLGMYVNQVADQLLSRHPDLRKRINIFVVKSPVVNAYTLDNGTILINIGLLAQLENEAELAYILAHEIVHFQERHAMQEYVSSSAKDKTHLTKEEYVLDRLSFSRENEIIADTKGLELVLHTRYDPNAAVSVLEVLKYAYLPFDEVPFDNSFFESDDLKLPANLKLDEVKPISADESYDDSKSTHPNIKTRRDTINYTLRYSVDTLTNRKKFLVANRERFKRLRTIARFETARLYLISQDYPEAIYTSYLLQKEYPNSFYLKQITAKAAYNLAVYKAPVFSDQKAEIEYSLPDYHKIEGNLQQVYFLFKKMYSKEATTVALSYCWRLKKEKPGDRELDKMCQNLFYLLANNPYFTPNYFRKRPLKKAIDPVANDTIPRELSKYEKIKSLQKNAGTIIDDDGSDPYQFAFSSLLENDNEFKNLFDRYLNSGKNIPKPSWMSEESITPSKFYDTLFVLDPLLMKYEYKATLFGAKPSISYDHSDFNELQEKYRAILTKTGENRKISLRFLDPTDLDSIDIELYNDISTIAEWMSENGRHTRPFALNSISTNLYELEAKYGRYLMQTISITERDKIKNLGRMIIISVVLYPVAIMLVPPMVFHKRYHHDYYVQILDTRKGEIVISHEKHANKNFKYMWIKRKMKRTFEEFEEKRQFN